MNIGIIFPKDSEAIFFKNSKRSYGGANIQLFHIACQLSKYNNINLMCFINDYNIPKSENGLTNSELKIVKTFKEDDIFIVKLYKLYKRIKKNKINILIQRGLTLQSCFLALFCYISKIKFVFMFAHDIESLGRYQKNRKKCFFFKMLMQFSYKLIVQNEFEYNNIVVKTKPCKVEIIKKGLPLERIKYNIKKPRKIYDCAWIARCDEWKNPEKYISLAKKFNDKNFLMIIPPSAGKEQYYSNILNEIKKLKNITYCDFIPNKNIYELLLKSKIFCITSDMEGDWPMVVLEAAYLGLPILSLHINYDGLIDTYGGGIFCNSDEELFYNNFNIMMNNPTLIKKLSKNAKRYVIENHNIVNNVEKLVNILIE